MMVPAVLPVVAVIGLLLYRSPGLYQSVAYLAGCMALCFGVIYVSLINFSQPNKDKDAALAPIAELVTKFRLDVTEMRESLSLLAALKRRVSGSEAKNVQAAREVFDLGLLNYALVFVQNLETVDRRIPMSCDIVNALLSQQKIRAAILDDDFLRKDTIDSLLLAVKELSSLAGKSAATEKERAAIRSLKDIDEDDVELTGAIEADFLFRGESQLCLPQLVHRTTHLKPPSKPLSNVLPWLYIAPKTLPNLQFSEYGYKLIMAIVSLSMDSLVGQNAMGDRGAIPIVLDIFRTYGPTSPEVAKWCSAAMFVSEARRHCQCFSHAHDVLPTT